MVDASTLAGWRRTLLADGLLLVAPDGPGGGVIRLRHTVRPLRTVRELTAFLTGQIRLADVVVDEPARFVTLEGEYAVLLSMRARGPAEELHRTVAIVLGDDSYDAVDGAAGSPDAGARVRAAVETLAHRSWLGLGERRRRRYFYQLPAGWQGIARAHAVDWIPPGFPRERATITVFDARPVGQTPYLEQDHALYMSLPAELMRDLAAPPQPIVSRFGLRGSLGIVSGKLPDGTVELVHDCSLADDTYAYMVRLTCGPARLDERRAALMELVASIEPLPVGVRATVAAHWAE